MKLTLPLAIVATLLAVFTAAAAPAPDKHELQMQMPDWSKTEVVAHDLGRGVHWLESFGGNIGVVVGPNGILLVDAEYPELNAKVRADLAALSPLPVRYVVNTHWHWDHVGADADWTRTGAVVIASEETWKHITAAEASPDAPKAGPYHPDPASLPVITVGQGAKLHLGGNTVEIMHIAPAHTDGDLLVRYPEADVI